MNSFEIKCQEIAYAHPELVEKIGDIYEMAYNEIRNGGSEAHEVELAFSRLEELLNDTNKET